MEQTTQPRSLPNPSVRGEKVKIKTYTSTFNSFGIIVSKDCVLQQWEPYEIVSHFEPYIVIYWFKRQIRFVWKVNTSSWLGRKLLAERQECQ